MVSINFTLILTTKINIYMTVYETKYKIKAKPKSEIWFRTNFEKIL